MCVWSWAFCPILLRLLDPAAVVVQAAEPKATRPGPVHRKDADGLGGGTEESPGHGLPMQEQPGRTEIEVLTEPPTWDEFYSNYVRPNKPVVIRGGATGQKAFTDWTDEYLVRRWGSSTDVNAELHKSEVRGGPSRRMSLEKYVEMIYKEENKDSMYAVIPFEDNEEWLQDFHMPSYANCQEIHPQSMTLWFSAGGTRSVLHQDDGENFLMLLDGQKEVFLVHQDSAFNLYAPQATNPGTSAVHHDFVDLKMFPRFGNVTWIHGSLEKGDTLYIPVGYWHQVNSFGRNLGVNFWWGHEGDYTWWSGGMDMTKLGSPGREPFDDAKAKLPAQAACTPLPADHDFNAPLQADERLWGAYLSTQRKRVEANKEPASAAALLRNLGRGKRREEL